VCCSVLQCVAVCCSAVQCNAVRCSVLQCVAVCCSAVHSDGIVFHTESLPLSMVHERPKVCRIVIR